MYIPWMGKYDLSIAQELRKYEELEIAVKQLTGYNFECLYKLFCMGWTLTEPETPVSMNQLLDLIEEV